MYEKTEEQIEGEARAQWDNSPQLRAEFAGSWAAYVAYVRAEARGQVRILGRKKPK